MFDKLKHIFVNGSRLSRNLLIVKPLMGGGI